jgi:hypothetical protein
MPIDFTVFGQAAEWCRDNLNYVTRLENLRRRDRMRTMLREFGISSAPPCDGCGTCQQFMFGGVVGRVVQVYAPLWPTVQRSGGEFTSSISPHPLGNTNFLAGTSTPAILWLR